MANRLTPLGSQGLVTSQLGFGCMSLTNGFYGAGISEEEAVAILQRSYQLGVRLFNTSDLYGPYTNETLVGKALKAVKSDICIATKWGPMFREGGLVFDLSPQYAREACTGSLERLGVDAIDLWTLRGPIIPPFNVEETMKGVKDDIIPTCQELGIGVLAYSPLGRGLLTGGFDVNRLDEKDSRRSHFPRFAADNLEKNQELAARVAQMAEAKGCTAGQLAIAWLLAKGEYVHPIPGTKRMPYLEENMGALQVQLSQQEIRQLEEVVPQGAVQGPRYGDMGITYQGAALSGTTPH